MSSRKANRRKRPGTPLGLFAVGAGLLLIGILAVFAFPQAESDAGSQAGASALPVVVDYPAPGLALTDKDGASADLEQYRGQVVLVNLWATWCPPCKAEMPTLQAYYDTYRADGFVLVAVNAGDGAVEVNAFVDRIGLTFPVWLDPDNAAMSAFRSVGLPSSYVIDRSGRVRLAWAGAIERLDLEKYVTPIIQE